jgi:hypothetical protein
MIYSWCARLIPKFGAFALNAIFVILACFGILMTGATRRCDANDMAVTRLGGFPLR